MVERLFILKNANMTSEADNNRVCKGRSFNTDDDDLLPTNDLQQTEENTSKYDKNLLGVDESKRSLLSFNSPSIDSVNDPEGSVSDMLLSDKLNRRKQRRLTIKITNDEQKKFLLSQRPWYTKLDLIKPIAFLVFLLLIYFMWIKRDVWIPRLLTSNSRVRHTVMRHEENFHEQDIPILNKDSSSTIIKQDEIINDNQSNSNQTLSDENNDNDESPISSTKQTSQKLNLRTRRNKMSFTRGERQTKTNRHSQRKIIDDDDDDDNDDEDEDDIDEEISTKETILPSSIHSTKKHHHHHHHTRSSKVQTHGKTSVIPRLHDDIVEQLTKLIKAHGKNRDLRTILTKETGLSKSKINRFIHQKDFTLLTLDRLISILNSFDSTILIVPK